MRDFNYKGLQIGESKGHGKAVKGTKETSTIQVKLIRGNSVLLVHQVRYKMDCPPCIDQAVVKAKAWVDKYKEMETEFLRCRDDKAYFVNKYLKSNMELTEQLSSTGKIQVDYGKQLQQMLDRLPHWMKKPFGNLELGN